MMGIKKSAVYGAGMAARIGRGKKDDSGFDQVSKIAPVGKDKIIFAPNVNGKFCS